jgi:dihydropteroate synthase
MSTEKPSPSFSQIWRCCGHELPWGGRTLVAGILNVTPDSFSDGGRFDSLDRAVRRAEALIAEGADLLDIGGESSRPGADPVSVEEEIRRVVPVVEAIHATHPEVPISVDTVKAEVGRRAIEAGACILNDITALRGDPAMAPLAARTGAGVVLMHMQGAPRTMQQAPAYADVVSEVEAFFRERIAAAEQAGIRPETICLDPGVGFGKRLEHNLALIRAGGRFGELGCPLFLGLSRKSFIGALLDLPVEQRLEGSLAAATAAVLYGAHIVRVHDVAATRRAVAVADALKGDR